MTVCYWDDGQICQPAFWVIAWSCNGCDQEDILDICDEHYQGAFLYGDKSPRAMSCPECHREVSWVGRSMNNFKEDSLINGKANGRDFV